mmetsp:Transcript_75582/g.216418  ORF Transcript_75582/g.216418 Transcript_75582/m.216418 type:complete len:213 (+) Transcript_75582:116-754(+)
MANPPRKHSENKRDGGLHDFCFDKFHNFRWGVQLLRLFPIVVLSRPILLVHRQIKKVEVVRSRGSIAKLHVVRQSLGKFRRHYGHARELLNGLEPCNEVFVVVPGADKRVVVFFDIDLGRRLLPLWSIHFCLCLFSFLLSTRQDVLRHFFPEQRHFLNNNFRRPFRRLIEAEPEELRLGIRDLLVQGCIIHLLEFLRVRFLGDLVCGDPRPS